MLALIFLAAQLQAATIGDSPRYDAASARDSVRDQGRARNAQASFERSRRSLLPRGSNGGGRCDVHLGRYCWWYDDTAPVFPPEATAITRRRAELLVELDALGEQYPGSDWLVAMRVHYRVDGRQYAEADSVARSCRANGWWCAQLVGYAAHARADEAAADSAFALSASLMPADVACGWRNIATLLAGDDRDAYEHRSCEERASLEQRYWLLSRPQLSTPYNEWKNEFNSRRVVVWLGERAATPHLLRWADDAAELVLRYGWPLAWSRVESSITPGADPSIIGHDPSPSFAFAPGSWLVDSLRPLGVDAWDMMSHEAAARYAPPSVRRVSVAAVQFARFRRGDSTLVVAAWAASDDSLIAPVGLLGVATADGVIVSSTSDSGRVGRGRAMMQGRPFLVGVDMTDTTRHAIGRMRSTLAAEADTGRLRLSDLLAYHAGEEPAASLDSALAHAVPGDAIARDRPVGLFWETYGIATAGESMDVSLSVERVDHSWIRSARQHLKLTPVDTPIRMHWSDERPRADSAAPHTLSLDLGNLDAGRYRLTLTLTPVDGTAVTTTRELSLIDR
ncbi:MAG: hypothetical protein M3Z05_15975 [Gemmatimonadota bacterium]|nr:hypothetical protein [Gemmatimonadota bacterium]